MKKTISIGIPCYNEELNVKPAYIAIRKVLEKLKRYDYQFVFADNGSIDNTKEEIRKIASKDKKVVGVFLSRNFGPESSAQAVIDYVKGEAFILYECDMQDPPELISEFVKKWEAGFDVVIGKRTKIEDNLLMTFLRKAFYKIFKLLANIDIPVNAGSYGLLDKRVLDSIQLLKEKYRFFRGLRAWVGFKATYVTYERRRRMRGKSSYNFFDYIRHAERSVFGFSYLLLDIIIYIGFALVLFSFVFIIIYFLLFIIFGNPIKGSVTILTSIVFFGGVQLLALSIIGKYIQVIMEETKSRPVYIIDEIVNVKKI